MRKHILFYILIAFGAISFFIGYNYDTIKIWAYNPKNEQGIFTVILFFLIAFCIIFYTKMKEYQKRNQNYWEDSELKDMRYFELERKYDKLINKLSKNKKVSNRKK